MNELKRMFEIQLKINSDKKNLDLKDKQAETKETILSMMSEINEILSEINWANYKTEKTVIKSNVIEEIVDVTKFLINLCIIWDLSPYEFMNEFVRKSAVVEQRIKQKKVLKNISTSSNKVCAIDLDGVIVKYPDVLLDMINEKFDTSYNNINIAKKNLDRQDYLDIKNRYRESGIKQSLPLVDGAKEFTDKLKDLGYKIIILTKRPYKKYYRIFADTKVNLDDNGIKYDAIIFDSEKHKKIMSELSNIEFMVEDNRVIANEISECGYKCYLLNNIYNKGEIDKNVMRVNALSEITNEIK